jgi:hypothetical protein
MVYRVMQPVRIPLCKIFCERQWPNTPASRVDLRGCGDLVADFTLEYLICYFNRQGTVQANITWPILHYKQTLLMQNRIFEERPTSFIPSLLRIPIRAIRTGMGFLNRGIKYRGPAVAGGLKPFLRHCVCRRSMEVTQRHALERSFEKSFFSFFTCSIFVAYGTVINPQET